MANEHHLSIILQGTTAWNEWRRGHPEVYPDLSYARFTSVEVAGTPLSNARFSGALLASVDLSHAKLHHIDLYNASLSGTSFQHSDLQGARMTHTDLQRTMLKKSNLSHAFLMDADLSGADLSDADLSGAYLSKANLSGANLQGANLSGAHLSGVIFNGTNLDGTRFDEAALGWAIFANVDLQRAIGLERVQHVGPSTIGVDTLLRSRGNIPASFLSGAGLQRALVESLSTQARQGVYTLTCSIGYSFADRSLAERLVADLQALGIPCWTVPRYHMSDPFPPGLNYNAATDFVHRYDRLVQLFSQDTLRIEDEFEQSDDIQDEVQTALQQEVQRHQQVLFPVRVDDALLTTDKPWAVALRRSHPILDFTRWQEREPYQEAFERLVRWLSEEEQPMREEGE